MACPLEGPTFGGHWELSVTRDILVCLSGKPSFAATNRALSQAGFSVKSYYRFKANHKRVITKWLNQHASKASQIKQLQTKRDTLSRTLEGAN